jgi:hypothetical protein
MLQRQISVVISLPMIVQLGKTLLLLKRPADYALGVVYHVKQQQTRSKSIYTGLIKSQGGEKKRVISARLAEQLKSAREEDD